MFLHQLTERRLLPFALWAVEDHLVTSVCVNAGRDTDLI